MHKTLFLTLFLFFTLFTFSQQKEIHLISWNIQDFGKTKNSEELEQIAELVRDADIVALQEVVSGYGGAQAVAKLADLLNRKGAQWDYVISNPTKIPKNTTERYAFIWKTKHIKIKNRGKLIKELETTVDREPFLLDFYVLGQKLTLLNFHSRPHHKNPEAEIMAMTQYLSINTASNMIIAGDFNINESHKIFTNLKSLGFNPAVTNEKTTLKRVCNEFEYRNHPIDNIFHSTSLAKTESGVIDFVRTCENLERSRKLSDHLPVYLKFKIAQ
ncbi:Metal-dependent hydrolase, endonuclease/exonuclease/phosphatase family [Maribacter sedimenticola]|uniref:Metal-dependent hydrolase, endonuclease/exonuclease/phosphatase family n=1 Tax=Maribacter sedimenticola TaxID=228956 RepID=A0ABY1SDF6_9FLAO|nr:endonuclease/exonuclease/phosphatase family protein [Maribacter sedimenticola]SNR27748.1 Metal-dependent hydrolase, endonuclease/exonuclease/phosphatase family [Maribacter sedimenticola]